MIARLLLATLTTATLMSSCTLAHAATTKYLATHISLNGSVVTSPQHTTAIDPSSHQETSYMPIYYAMEVLKKLGITSTWDGTTWSLTVPGSLTPDLSNPTTATNQMYIKMNGVKVEAAPKLVAVDPSSKQNTTFIPIYYLEQALKRIGVTSTWDGTTWTMATASTSKPVYPAKYPATTSVTKSTTTATKPSLTTMTDEAKAVFASISYTVQGNYRVFKLPVFTEYSGWQLNEAFFDTQTHQQLVDTAQWSDDNGKTWHTAHAGYDSLDSTQGGVTSTSSSSPGYVLVRGPESALAGIGFGWNGRTASEGLGYLRVYPDGSVYEGGFPN